MLAKAKWIAGCLRACLGAAAGLQQSQWSSAAVGAVCPVCVFESLAASSSAPAVCLLHWLVGLCMAQFLLCFACDVGVVG